MAMRVVHLARSNVRYAEPLCGDWGSMDTDWTDFALGVTCQACLVVLRRDLEQEAAARPVQAGRTGETRWTPATR
jgi:hypothetical protein